MERNVGTLGSAKYELATSPDAARAFKAGPVMLIVGSMRLPFVDRAYIRERPTISDPDDRTTISYGYRIDPQCIVFAHGATEVARIGSR